MTGSGRIPEAVVRRGGGVAVFLGVSFGVTWLVWAPLVTQAQQGALTTVPWTFFFGSLGPACAAVAASVWEGGWREVARWARRAFSLRFAARWWIAAIGMPVAYFVIGYGVATVVTGAWPDASQFGATDKLPGLAWPLVAVVWVVTFGLGEESGWRGWLLPALTRRMSVFWATLIVAAVWIAWHAPAFLFNPTYTAMGPGIIGWMLALVTGSFLLSWMAQGARWSIVPVLIWHAGFDLLTAADQSAGVIASTISAIVMAQGAVCAWLLWRDARARRVPAPMLSP